MKKKFIKKIPSWFLYSVNRSLEQKLGIISYPKFLNLLITWKCNSRCHMCDIWKIKKRGYELSVDDIDELLKDKYTKKLEHVRLDGGEVTLRNDLNKIIETIHNRNKKTVIGLNTNGFLKKRLLDAVNNSLNMDIKPDISLSVDGIDGVHDNVRGVNSAFKMVYATLKELKKIRDRTEIPISLSQTISRLNWDQICPVYDLAKKLNFGYACTIAWTSPDYYIKPSKSDHGDISFEKFEQKQIEKIASDLKAIYGGKTNLASYFTSGMINRIAYNKNEPNPPCMAFSSYVTIKPNGDVIPCSQMSNTIVGNIRNQKFSEIWKSKKAKKIRNIVKNCDLCWEGCNARLNGLYSGEFFKWVLKKKMGW